MFGATPLLFQSPEAAKHVAAGYEVEENEAWLVVYKETEGHTYFRPCRRTDLKEAEKEGYQIYFKN